MKKIQVKAITQTALPNVCSCDVVNIDDCCDCAMRGVFCIENLALSFIDNMWAIIIDELDYYHLCGRV